MCFELAMTPGATGKVSARALESVSGLVVTETDQPFKSSFVFGREPGCSCALMSDEADPDGPVWALEPAVLGGLAAAAELLATRAAGVRLQAVWMGESVQAQERIELKWLLHLIRHNAIGNRHAYLVGSKFHR
jgi:hypothetical protein